MVAIYYNELGNLGHLGNQMFQYASLQGIAYNRGFDWKIPHRDFFGMKYPSIRSKIYDCFYLDLEIDSHIGINYDIPSVFEDSHGFNSELFNNCNDDVNLSGYFQSYRYFDSIKNKIKRDFTFKPRMLNLNKRENTVAIHVRRTDYLGLSEYHTNLSEEYYAAALDTVAPFKNAIVFSDDIEWCRSFSLFKGFDFVHTDPYEDLKLMTLCDRHILANSTFGWWGAYLSDTESVVAPKDWFGPALPDHDPSGYFLPDWNII
jgi:hypothetical protein